MNFQSMLRLTLLLFTLAMFSACNGDGYWDNGLYNGSNFAGSINTFALNKDNISVGSSVNISMDIDYARTLELYFLEDKAGSSKQLLFRSEPLGRPFIQTLVAEYRAGQIIGKIDLNTPATTISINDNSTYNVYLKICGYERRYNEPICMESQYKSLTLFNKPPVTP